MDQMKGVGNGAVRRMMGRRLYEARILPLPKFVTGLDSFGFIRTTYSPSYE